MILLPAFLGAFTGLILGLTGAGGGALAGPLLILVLGLPLTQAASISLAAVALAAGLGTVIGLRRGVVRYRAASLMALTGILASPLGIMLSRHLPETPLILMFAAVLAAQARRQWRGLGAEDAADPVCVLDANSGRFLWDRPCARALAGSGALAGLLSGMLGVGGGFILVPALSRHSALNMESITATSLMVLTLVALAGLAQWAGHGDVPWAVALPFMAASVVGLILGRWILPRLPALWPRRLFAVLAAVTSAALVLKLALHA